MAIENILEAYGNNLVGAHIDNSSGSGGHTIQDASGNDMPTQPNLQFADANVSNDGTNNATVVRNFVDIDWDDWQKVDDNDDTYYRVTDAPLVDGNVEVDLMKKLWENPAPTASFVAQTVTLNSADYDFLYIECAYAPTSLSYGTGSIISKDRTTRIQYEGSNGSVYGMHVRNVGAQANDKTKVDISVDNFYPESGANPISYNEYTIPVAIYGIKQKISISLSAIISNVSTSASKCMLSDGETSVADALDWQYLGQTTGNTEITIPENATEVICSSAVSSTVIQFNFATIQDDINVARQGFYSGANNYGTAMFKWIKSTRKANLYSFTFAGTDYTSTAVSKWYIRVK